MDECCRWVGGIRLPGTESAPAPSSYLEAVCTEGSIQVFHGAQIDQRDTRQVPIAGSDSPASLLTRFSGRDSPLFGTGEKSGLARDRSGRSQLPVVGSRAHIR